MNQSLLNLFLIEKRSGIETFDINLQIDQRQDYVENMAYEGGSVITGLTKAYPYNREDIKVQYI